MEVVTTGYKQTKIGKIPEDWAVVRFEDLTSLMTNGFVGTATPYHTEENNGVTYLQGFNIRENRIDLTGVTKVTKEFHSKQSKSILQVNDLLTVQSGHIGTTAVVTNDLVGANCHALIISRFKNKDCDSNFFAYYLNSSHGKQRLSGIIIGSTIMHINVKDLKKFLIPLPPFPEQNKIAEILSTVDEKIAQTQAIIGKNQELKKGLLKQLFACGIGYTKFKMTKIGEIPEEWDLKTIADITNSKSYGPRFSADLYDLNGNVKTIRGTDFTKNGTIIYDQVPIAKLDAKIIKTHKLINNDLVVVTTADCGLSAVFIEQDISYIPSAYTVRFRLNDIVYPNYLRYLMLTHLIKSQVIKYIRKATVENLASSDISKFLIPIPSIDEQKRIAHILSEVDNKIKQENNNLDELQYLKKGLMQVLLTGKIRVNMIS